MSETGQNPAPQSQGTELTLDALDSLLSKSLKLKQGSEAESIASRAVRNFLADVVADRTLVSDDVMQSIRDAKSRLDEKLTEQINEILHHEDFQKLESAWRGLHHFVSNTECDSQMKIRVMNVSKEELGSHLRKFKGAAWDQSPLFKRIYENEYGQAGGEPYGVLIGDYHFDHSAPDIALMQSMAKIAAAAHAPFISGAAPSLFGLDSWEELNEPTDLTKKVSGPEHAAWRSLRDSEDARYLGLAMPRFLARLPYDPKNNPVEGIEFEEDTAGTDHKRFCWANAAYAMGVNVTRAQKAFGWTSMIRGKESGGLVEGLPVHTFATDDGGVDQKCPTEVSIPDRREKELEDNGLMALIHWKNSDYAAFLSATSIQKPAKYDSPEASANAALSARLNYLFAANRFAHYLKCMVRDKIGSFKERADMQRWLNDWINQYVLPNAHEHGDEMKARRPLAAASVEVTEIEGAPGYYAAKFNLRPHYQLEGLTTTMSLVSSLPSG